MDEFTEAELNELHADFEAAQRRPLKTRLHSAFIKTYKPRAGRGHGTDLQHHARVPAVVQRNAPGLARIPIHPLRHDDPWTRTSRSATTMSRS